MENSNTNIYIHRLITDMLTHTTTYISSHIDIAYIHRDSQIHT